MRKKIDVLMLAAAAFAAVSCASVQKDVRYETERPEAAVELESLELDLVRTRTVPDAAALAAVRARTAEALAMPSTDAAYRARLFALAGEAALQAGDRVLAARRLAESRAAYPGDELAAVLDSRLATDPADRLAALEKSAALSDSSLRLKAELGSALLASGRVRDALAAFDAALPRLGSEYAELYGAERDRAYALRDAAAPPEAASAAYLTRETLPLVGMAVLAQAETNALDHITGGASWAPGVLFDRLKAAGWYAPSASSRDAATRKDAALFLWRLMTRSDPKTARRFTDRYAGTGASPLPDVPYGSPFFDAILGAVEEDVLPLVGGRLFSPDSPVAGLDFYTWLRAAAAWR